MVWFGWSDLLQKPANVCYVFGVIWDFESTLLEQESSLSIPISIWIPWMALEKGHNVSYNTK
jgi:hypothetical protein